MKKRGKKRAWKAAGALLFSAVLALSAPVSHLPAGLEAYAEGEQADENGFLIVNGVLQKYSGTAAEVVIPEGVTSIKSNAFYGCSSLTSITIPDSVTSIENYAITGCSSLSSIMVEKGNTSYDSRGNCNAIIESSSNTLMVGCKNTVIPDSVTSIGQWAFYLCSDLASISIPDSVTSIGAHAFSLCRSLTSISIPNSVTSIGNNVFSGCSSLTSVTIPEGVTRIGNNVFSDCSSLTNVAIPEGVTSIDSVAFYGCSSLTSIILPESVTSIGDWAFNGCSSLTSITIPECVTSIGNHAFNSCSSLSGIVVDAGNTSYDSRGNCNAIIESSSNTLIAGCKNTIIPDSVTSIEESAFYGCSSLTSISIPDSVTSIGNNAFSDCVSLSSIAVEKGNTNYDSRNNCNAIIESSSNTLIAGCKNTVIPEDVTGIGNHAFNSCSFLTSITIPDNVTGIGNNAFYGCSGLTSISIPESVTSIGHSAFFNCSSLSSITIPEGVTSIGGVAFYGCSSLTSITIPESMTSIGNNVFSGCSSLSSIIIPDSVTSIDNAAFSGCNKLIIYGEEGSYAQTYAKANNIPFRLLGSQDIFTTAKLTELTEENKAQDTVIETADGLTFTFKKGTMDLVNGVDSYDFGAEITEDYDSLLNQDFAEEEFAFRIHFYHSGQLPGEAEITIPADSKWAGQKLYYYEIKEDGTYNYVCRSTVEEDGSYTVKQSHCSAYVATTKVPENLGNCDGKEGITSSDALAVLRYEVGIDQTDFDVRFADCDGKEGITSSDALAILRYEVNVIDALE